MSAQPQLPESLRRFRPAAEVAVPADGKRTARTLLKDGPLRVTVIALGKAGHIAEHHAAGPITIQLLSGELVVTVGGADHELAPGDVLALQADVEHAVRSAAGGVFLLTMALTA